MNNLLKITGTVVSINESKLARSGSFRTSFVLYGKVLDSMESFVCQYFSLGEFPLQVGKQYHCHCEPKGIKIKDPVTLQYRYFNTWNVVDYSDIISV